MYSETNKNNKHFSSSRFLNAILELRFLCSLSLILSLILREAVTTCQCLELKSLRFESDSGQLIKDITLSCLSKLYSVVFDILAIVAEFEFVSFV